MLSHFSNLNFSLKFHNTTHRDSRFSIDYGFITQSVSSNMNKFSICVFHLLGVERIYFIYKSLCELDSSMIDCCFSLIIEYDNER